MPGFFLACLLLAPLLASAVLRARRLARDLRAAEDAAGAARRQAEGRGRCLGLVAQELQGPGLALLSQSASLPEATATEVATVAQQMLRLSDDVAEYLAVEAGPRRLAPEPLPLIPLLKDAVAEVAIRLGPGRRDWRLAGGFAGLILEVDRRALHGALTQILARAARMTREGDQIDLRPILTEESLAIVVEDEGAGLPAADLAAGAPHGTRGLGFGMAIARSLVEAHGGSLRLEALPGIGGRIWLTLPRERLLAAQGKARGDGPPPGRGSMREPESTRNGSPAPL